MHQRPPSALSNRGDRDGIFKKVNFYNSISKRIYLETISIYIHYAL